MSEDEQRFDTLAIHAGQHPEPMTGAVMTPVFQTSTYAQKEPGQAAYEYSRTHNPTRDALQDCIAALEGGKFGLCFASGLAATDTLLRTFSARRPRPLRRRSLRRHVPAATSGDRALGVVVDTVDLGNPDALRAAMRAETRLVWVEIPPTRCSKIIDLSQTAEVAHQAGAKLVVDTPSLSTCSNRSDSEPTWSCTRSPSNRSGHSDLIGGALVLNDDEISERIAFHVNAVGAVPCRWIATSRCAA